MEGKSFLIFEQQWKVSALIIMAFVIAPQDVALCIYMEGIVSKKLASCVRRTLTHIDLYKKIQANFCEISITEVKSYILVYLISRSLASLFPVKIAILTSL